MLTDQQPTLDRAEEAELECWLPHWFPGEGWPQTWRWAGQDRKQKAGLELSQLQGGQQEKHQPSARRGKCRNSQREVGFPGWLQDWISGQREASTRWRRQEDIRRQGVRPADEQRAELLHQVGPQQYGGLPGRLSPSGTGSLLSPLSPLSPSPFSSPVC